MKSLNCTKNNLHFPAFKRVKKRIARDVVICCDPLSLLWASVNVSTDKLLIGVFHKDEWRLNVNNIFEKTIEGFDKLIIS